MMKGYSRSLYRVESLYPGKRKLHHTIQKYKFWYFFEKKIIIHIWDSF